MKAVSQVALPSVIEEEVTLPRRVRADSSSHALLSATTPASAAVAAEGNARLGRAGPPSALSCPEGMAATALS